MINSLFIDTVTVYRRTDQGRDVLGNPTYGTPLSGAGWAVLYANISVRLALGETPVIFAPTGERITPKGVVYFPPEYEIVEEDRLLTSTGIEYVIVSAVTGIRTGSVIDHYEALIDAP